DDLVRRSEQSLKGGQSETARAHHDETHIGSKRIISNQDRDSSAARNFSISRSGGISPFCWASRNTFSKPLTDERAASLASGPIMSMNKTPLRWSISCCQARASRS